MNKNRFKHYVIRKDVVWQVMFCYHFFKRHNLKPHDLKFVRFGIGDCLKLVRNVDDLQNLWEIAEYVDFYAEEIMDRIADIHFTRPVSWQYDFVEIVANICGVKIVQTLNINAITTTVAVAWAYDADIDTVSAKLDEKYACIFSSLQNKLKLLKRNFILTLETYFNIAEPDANITFRELLNEVMPKVGKEAVVKAYRQSVTEDVKLTSEEKECLSFLHHCPCFDDAASLANKKMPQSALFRCVEDQLTRDAQWYEACRADIKQLEFEYQNEDDDDDDDGNSGKEGRALSLQELQNILLLDKDGLFSNYSVYLDQQMRCVINTRFLPCTYANVYIERFPHDDLNNSVPDFIRYHKGCLYTVEFVDSLDKLEPVGKLNRRLATFSNIMKQLLLSYDLCQTISDGIMIRRQIDDITYQIERCFYIS